MIFAFLCAGIAILALSLVGTILTWVAALRVKSFFARRMHRSADEPVTLLKPLHGHEPGLHDNLASFCVQDYGAPVQIVFGVQNAADPAIRIVEGLRAEFPTLDICLVVDETLHGTNRKVSNLINMAGHAKHDILVHSDSDIAVARDYVNRVTAALAEPGVGAVTCLYAGRERGPGFWPHLAAMGISYQFLPNAILGLSLGLARPCFGSTIALSKPVLASIGGFQSVANLLADDYALGDLVRQKGYRVAVPPFLVRHDCAERRARELFAHELRWGRTIRAVNGLGHLGSIVTFPLPLALLGLAFPLLALPAAVLAAAALTARLFLKDRLDFIIGRSSGSAWLVPLRDVLSFVVFAVSLVGKSVHWRGADFKLGSDGALTQV